MICVKEGVLDRLKAAGFSSYRIRKEAVFSQSTVTNIRNRKTIGTETLDQLCTILNCQPGDILEYKADGEV